MAKKIVPLTRDMVNDPTNWRLSMMLCANTLEVVARSIVGEPSLINATIDLDTSLAPAAAIEEAIYANPLLLQPFGKTDIVVRTDKFQILPSDSASNTDTIDAILDLLPHPEGRPATFTAQLDNRYSMLTMIDRGISNFIARTFFNTVPTTHLSILSAYFTHKSRMGNSGKLFINLYLDQIDILAYNSLGLTAANTFTCSDDNDAAYYILATAKQIEFDFNNDEIFISGNTERRTALMSILRQYAAKVMPAIFPSTAFGSLHSALHAPFELIILPLCE